MNSGGRITQIFYLSKSSHTTVKKYSVLSKTQNVSRVKVKKHYKQNILKVSNVKVLMPNGSFQSSLLVLL